MKKYMNEAMHKIQDTILNAVNVENTEEAKDWLFDNVFKNANKNYGYGIEYNMELVRKALIHFNISYLHIFYRELTVAVDEASLSPDKLWNDIATHLPYILNTAPVEKILTYLLCEDFKDDDDYELYTQTVLESLVETQNTYGAFDFSFTYVNQYLVGIENALKLIDKYDESKINGFRLYLTDYYDDVFKNDQIDKYPGLYWEFFVKSIVDKLWWKARHKKDFRHFITDNFYNDGENTSLMIQSIPSFIIH